MIPRVLSRAALAAALLMLLPPADAQSRRRDPAPAEAPVGAIETGLRDGQWYAAAKVSSPGSHALQVLIEDMALPSGAVLKVYELDILGARAGLAATYEGSGPLGGGAFLTGAVKGSAAILEVVYGEVVAVDLPLRIAEVRGLDANQFAALSNANPSDAEGTTELFEGDIILQPGKVASRDAMGITSSSYRWSGGIVPYIVDAAMPNQYRITDAVAHWNAQLAGTIQLVPRTNQAYYVRFVLASNAGTCSSYIGRIGVAAQPINVGNYCSTGNVVHEIGHAVGLFHEHTREDRNTFVQILFENIDPATVSNFNQAISTSDDLGAYDYNSIMHYPATAFSINGSPTIVTIPPGIPIGQRSTLSPGDINGVRLMYPSTPTPPPNTVAIGFASNPTGRALVIDGATITPPVTYQWTPGSVHTVSAPSATVGNTRYNYASWSDGGAQSHSITTPTTARTYTASFAVQHKVTAVSSNTSLGTVTKSPNPADGFHNQGSTVTLTATPIGGACFTGWSGITAPASSPVQGSVTAPFSATGNFLPGSITVSPTSVTVPWTGGTYTLNVTANTGCSWTANSTSSWIEFSARSGTGSGVVRFSVDRRNANSSRTGTITIGNATVTVTQTRR